MAYKNKQDKNDYNRRHYAKYRAKTLERIAKNKQVIAKWFRDYKSELSCELCGESESVCLDFHHLRDKKHVVSKMAKHGYSIKTILAEIDKCVVLCANCHRKKHAGLV